MSYIVFHNMNNSDIYHMQLNTINSESLRLIREYSAEILSSDATYHRLLIDTSKIMLLPLPVLANEIRTVTSQNEYSNAAIAIVIDNQLYTDKLSEMIKTIVERNSVELFTTIEMATLWLELENNRYMKRHH